MNTPKGALPVPDSDELRQLLPSRVHQVIYRIMYEHRDEGITRQDLRVLAAPEVGDQEQLDRRARALNKKFLIEKVGSGKQTRHRLVGLRAQPGADIDDGITGAQRWRVLERGRCYGCGKTPAQHGVVLVVDHIIPRDLGGPSEDWNLQPLCEKCNADKKARFSAFGQHREALKKAMQHKEVQKRIGELLLAFNGAPVPSDLVQIVACAGEYRDDWKRRVRDLRTLGWKIQVRKRKEGPRRTADYLLIESQPWPDMPIARALDLAKKGKPNSQLGDGERG